MTTRQRIESGFESWGHFACRHRWQVVLAMIAVTAGLGSQLGRLDVDTSTEGLLRPDDPIRLEYDSFRERFGRDQMIMMSIEPPEIFDLAFLEKLRAFHDDLDENVPKVADLTSLVNVRSTYGRENELVVDDLLEEMPTTPVELAALRERVMSSPFYRDLVITADGTLTTVVIETDAYSSLGEEADDLAGFGDDGDEPSGPRPIITGEEEAEIVAATLAIVDEYSGPDFAIRTGGNVLFPVVLQQSMAREMPRFFGSSLLAIALLIFLLFRRVSAVVLSLVVVVMAVVATFSGMAIVGFKVKLPTQILPSFLLAVGISYAVHLLAVFFQRLDRGADRNAAVAGALGHSGLPILLTGITTIVGVLSFTTAALAPVADFGFTAAFGVCVTLLYSLVLLPALLAIAPVKGRPASDGDGRNRILAACGHLATSRPWAMVGAAAVLMLVAVAALPSIYTSANPLRMFPETHPLRVTTEYLDERMGGSVSFEVLVETDRENGLHEPAMLRRLASFEQKVQEYDDEGELLGRTISVLDVVRETHQALNENQPAFYTIPDSRQLLAQELLLFENSGSDDLERLVDSRFSQARFTVRAAFIEPAERALFLDRVEREFQEIMGDQARVTVTGILNVMTHTARATVESMVSSYLLAFALITPLMMLLIGSLRAGLVSMVPNLLPIVLTLGLMAALGKALDMFTLMTGCIAVGLAVDDTIHFIHSYRRSLQETGDPVQAVDQALQTTGRALLFTSLILTCGFLVFSLSSMAGLQTFGLLLAFAISTAFLLDILVTPALLVLISRRSP